MIGEPDQIHRAVLSRGVQELRARLPLAPMVGIPPVDALDEEAQAQLREIGADRLSCVAAIVRYRIIGGPAGAPVHAALPSLVLAEAASLVHASIRTSDLVLVLAPDTLIVLSPGVEPLGGRTLLGRLEEVLAHRKLKVKQLMIELNPVLASTYRSPSFPTSWDVPSVAQEARRRAASPSGVYRLPVAATG